MITATRTQRAYRRMRCLLAATLLAASIPAGAQYANADLADWKEGTVPPPPAYSLSGLVDIEMPRGSSVRMGVDPNTIALNHDTGIVRYVAVARGPSAVNATYEGIRCATGEFRIYARQVQGGEWTMNSETDWKAMQGQNNIMVKHPLQLARGGMCMGSTLRQDAKDIVRELKSGNQSLYY
ncbi:hypothetical protein FVQ98_04920 [Ottowia sp. GY511]|uniref:CNP1-like family protein n=1 Tax=Ottowia flava TaxID=2675430 RepID=A0ABW4KX67_9BURK|nr:CNP1-like family protein [Ottowia sp. GY511]TXK31318.1 hypothetical protein FVQ98_04920 [Ottowia sp. GY511]